MSHVHVFDREKARVLGKADLSRKGSVDAPIRQLVEYINTCEDFYTTSSCSGRAIAFCEDQSHRKKGCHWLLVSHDPISSDELLHACKKGIPLKKEPPTDTPDPGMGYTFFKFEPFVLHMMCRTMECAQLALQVAVGSGFRNSGITCGRKGKTMLAIRSTHSLEIPLCYNGELLVSKQYLGHVVELCNGKFLENSQRIERLFSQLKEVVECRKAEESFQAVSKEDARLTTKRQKVETEGTRIIDKTESVAANTCSRCDQSKTCSCEDDSQSEDFCFEGLFEPCGQ